MNPTIIYIVVLCMFCISCKPKPVEKESGTATKVELQGKINVSGAFGLYPLMKIWADEFTKENPGLEIIVNGSGTEKGIEDLISGKTDMAMVSRCLTESELKENMWKVPVTKEGVLPIVSEKNPFLDSLLKRGGNKNTFIKIFSSDKIAWKDLIKTTDSRNIKVYLRERTSGATEAWSEYICKKPSELQGIELLSDSDIIKAVVNDPFSIAFCNAHYAYNMVKQKQQDGIRVLPIDIDNNGKIDSKELVYNKLCQVQRAGYLGFFPHELCREMSIICLNKPQETNTKEFIKWILTKGQAIAVNNGYSELRRCEIEEIIKKM